MESDQPSIEILGLRVDTPMTTLTDVIIAIVCLYAFYKLWKNPNRNRLRTLLMYYFLLMAGATAIGGIIGHGLLYLLSFEWKLPGWLLSMIAVALIERAAIEYARPLIAPKVGKFFVWLNLTELVTFVALAFINLNFVYVEIHALYGLLIVVGSFSAFTYRKTKSRGSLLYLYAVGLMAMACIVFVGKISPHIWFNHFDLSHLFMTFSAYVFYMGSKILVENPIVNQSS